MKGNRAMESWGHETERKGGMGQNLAGLPACPGSRPEGAPLSPHAPCACSPCRRELATCPHRIAYCRAPAGRSSSTPQDTGRGPIRRVIVYTSNALATAAYRRYIEIYTRGC